MIREAKQEDLGTVYELLSKFFKESKVEQIIGIDYEYFTEYLQEFYENKNNKILIYETDNEIVGFLTGSLTPHFVNPSALMAVELAWWVKPEERSSSIGIKLMEAFNFWAKTNKAKVILFSSIIDPENSKLDKFYKTNGFKVSEISYIKEIV